ncbi:Eco57I restriction-modification methylase domain-containing protein [Streptomyces caniscabiei]|uniref:site-specific DNA-methyltransferase (adenine-specific) n=1 Tax=Streptomyces caniscabiei TaxID=2746961 RepID=A0ABU4MWQ4_9ACTN|nr:N-6 DNA methylase [Streptomyces caniscabiei]MBE4740739.1 N-6 DNA methylase [Streptomyces caniscabiei]MBE4759366.1 N-6 DNA methylase [Streptomyces caniscabiei]MBE4769142.1 N-6 DNA methylase [Streptomyces caniscabiei]MBE4788868.1 N-6 DNA methylase [Streptomyces caniscabiei]MBE4798007.1 N-6 DNA methylase [Streptomyces caniscabiei]
MSATTRNQVFTAVHTVGGLLPADMLVRISEGKDVPGSKPADYGLPSSRSVRDEAERSWEYLKPLWRELRKRLPEDRDTGVPASDPTGLAENDWLTPLWRELGFGRLTHIGAAGITADSDAEKKFPVSHRWHHALIHQTAWNAELDRRPGGAGTVPPQSMLQECLNRTESHLWGVLTNGRQVRLLRDSSALATASYVEFDLEAIFDGELFSEFVLLYRLLHASRFEVAEGGAPSGCWLEKWRTEAIASGTRALDQLRKGVQAAITALGTGFLRHPENGALREDVRPKALQAALLRMVYRLLFVFVAEDRDALLSPGADGIARERYETYFSSARLRAHARKRRGTAHSDLYEALRIVLTALGDEKGRPELGLPGLGGLFNDTEADAPLRDLKLSNEALLTAVRHLSQVRDGSSGRWRAVDYRHLDAEELGSVYESLLELEPKYSAADRTFALVEVAGNTRKTTGSYYTPSSLIECLLNSTLDPVIKDAVQRGEEEAARTGAADPADAIVNELLSLTVCDPACGSGHFLVAAARRIAKQVAAVRERNPEPTLDAVRHALHEVVARCIYGVDLNPMAVDLAKVSLWLEALEPGKPLSFLDAHVKHGNGLIGATPKLLRDGIPDEAFIATEGDDKKHAKALEKINQQERVGQGSLFDLGGEAVNVANTAFASGLRSITLTQAEELTDVRRQEDAYEKWTGSSDYQRALRVADAWCAAFVWLKTPEAPRPVTYAVFKALEDPSGQGVAEETKTEIIRLRKQFSFFHWHLEFPEVFSVPEDGRGVSPDTGWAGGFDCVVGNPPWDSVEFKEQEFFAQRVPEIAEASRTAVRKKMIEALKDSPDTESLYEEFEAGKRKVYAESHFLRRSGRVPLTGQGNLNTYAVFTETDRILLGPKGRAGVIVPTGIATDARTQHFSGDLVRRGAIAALYDFENALPLFPGVHRSFKFSILSLVGRSLHVPAARFAFFLQDPAELDDTDKVFPLTPEEIELLNPNTGTLPVFRSRRDANIAIRIYRRVPVLIKEGAPKGNPWGLSFLRMFDMSHESALFRSRTELESDGWTGRGNAFTQESSIMLPLYEAKMVDFFNHRAADVVQSGTAKQRQNQPRYLTSEDLQVRSRVVMPSNWVSSRDVARKVESRSWKKDWFIGWRDVTSPTNERTVIVSAIPMAAAANSLPVSLLSEEHARQAGSFISCLSSFVLDFAARLKVGGLHLNFFICNQLPVLPPQSLACHGSFIKQRFLELCYTADDMASLAHELGDSSTPFLWDEARREVIRIELDALFFHLYGVSREDVDYILDTFPIVRRKDEAKYGTYRTKELILAEYDRMAAAGLTLENPLVEGGNYTSTLTPPPGHGPRHPAKTPDGRTA